jgi:hypothetical protein
MIENVAYFPLQCAKNSQPVMSAVLGCLQSRGIQTQANSWTADAAIIWSVLWNGRMAANQQVYQHYRAQGLPVIVIEIGTLHRGVTWKVAVNNITADGYYGHQDHLDWDRPSKLGISLSTQSVLQPNIVVALQHTRSLQLQGIDINNWLIDTVQHIRTHTDRPITVRPHPRCKFAPPSLPKDVVIESPKLLVQTYDSFDLHYNCHAVVNFNSGPGVQAALAGVRPLVDATSLAAPVGIDFAEIERPYQKDRESWLVQICHTEYTVEELAQGIWLNRIAPALH